MRTEPVLFDIGMGFAFQVPSAKYATRLVSVVAILEQIDGDSKVYSTLSFKPKDQA